MTVAQEFGLPIIPNLIFGTPGEELGLVVRWVHKHRIQIPVVNVNFLSNIYGANSIRKPGDLPVARNACDADQNDYRKSWQNEDSTMRMLQAIRAVFYLTAGEDYTPSLYSEELRKTSIENVLDYFLS